MLAFIPFLFINTLPPATSKADKASSLPPKKEILRFYSQMDQALIRRNFAIWKQVLADNCTVRQATEPVRYHKMQILALMESMSKVTTIIEAKSVLKELKPSAEVPGTWIAKVDYSVLGSLNDSRVGGNPKNPPVVSQKQAILDTWRKEKGQWHLTTRVVTRGDD